MEITLDFKNRIVAAIKADRVKYASDSKHALALGLNKAVYSEIVKGRIDRKLADAGWITVARKLDVSNGARNSWQPARTAVYEFIHKQLRICQQELTAGLLCDEAGIGKSFAAKDYCKSNPNAVLIDCSEHPTKYALVRAIAKAFGLPNTGKLRELKADLVYYIKMLHNPLIILDESGDLEQLAWLEAKSLYNMLEGHCGWYMMGADGLRAKIKRNITLEVVGFTEMFDRFGREFQRITPKNEGEFAQFTRHQAKQILAANLPQCKDTDSILGRSKLSLRRLQKEIVKSQKSL